MNKSQSAKTVAPALEVTITVSEPYVLIGGGWTGMRPLGLRRDYRAEVDGVTFANTNKAQIMLVIRQHLYRKTGNDRVNFTFTNEVK